MVTIIRKSVSFANSPALTNDEIMVRATDWSEILFPIVPVHRLNETVRLAFENHTGTFPINAYDIKTAYDVVKANTPKEPYCLNFGNHINGQPEIMFFIPGVMQVDALVPCGSCRPAEFHQTKVAIIEQAKRGSSTGGGRV